MFGQDEQGLVDAIENGRIVRVSEEYARIEGLTIIRRSEPRAVDSPKTQEQMKLTPRLRGERKAYFDIDKYRRPWHDKNTITNSLIDNFHWVIGHRRKQLNLSRRQLAVAINAVEEDIKMFENGVIPHADYILINKLESYLKVNLRRDSVNKSMAPSDVSVFKQQIHKPRWTERMHGRSAESAERIAMEDIEIIDDIEEKKEDR